jgi:hypothetical protein
MTSFNEYNVNSFFSNLENALAIGFGPESIWNYHHSLFSLGLTYNNTGV